MKKTLIIATALLLAINGFSQGGPKKNADAKSDYTKNLATLKAAIAAFLKGDMDTWATYIADDAKLGSPVYGDTITTKAHWKESLGFFAQNWDNITLTNTTYLPGVDSSTMEFDGSVRYYGQYNGTYKANGMVTHLQFYGSYDFTKDHKIKSGNEYADIGGLMNAVMAKQ